MAIGLLQLQYYFPACAAAPVKRSSMRALRESSLAQGIAGLCPKAEAAVQAQKVRGLLRERGLGSVRVGTVDDYQGQEERIIFISTVSPPHPPVQDVITGHAGSLLMPAGPQGAHRASLHYEAPASMVLHQL